MKLSETDLIFNPDGSIYHLNLRPEHIADTIITVGDPERVPMVSKYFDSVEIKVNKREFVTHTGKLGKKRITVISSGIGTDNVEILMNELDALVNVNFQTREVKPKHKSLNIIRIGTSGSLQANIPINSVVVSALGIGMDALGFFYDSYGNNITEKLKNTLGLDFLPYCNPAGADLFNHFMDNAPENWVEGTTVTCPGFYAPQGRVLRYKAKINGLMEKMSSFNLDGIRLSNLEMETAGYYLMGKLLGHQVLSISAILASRKSNEFSKNPEKQVDTLIKQVLERLR
ncbi:nucleoside phosphorylase [Arcicella sp. LKC2W]|uniref:nucleoside phosphorylase n=1 Tax=Arcicella sp. LKC2W TaxID=2984198 RepID=UPI002B1F0F1A|nr:nucleoside phosphorylase [Arcicella sp. LKC2W]MEA5458538.1 nucleoside phosphorylase [Arcicella sp. LKC2W]